MQGDKIEEAKALCDGWGCPGLVRKYLRRHAIRGASSSGQSLDSTETSVVASLVSGKDGDGEPMLTLTKAAKRQEYRSVHHKVKRWFRLKVRQPTLSQACVLFKTRVVDSQDTGEFETELTMTVNDISTTLKQRDSKTQGGIQGTKMFTKRLTDPSKFEPEGELPPILQDRPFSSLRPPGGGLQLLSIRPLHDKTYEELLKEKARMDAKVKALAEQEGDQGGDGGSTGGGSIGTYLDPDAEEEAPDNWMTAIY